MGGDRIHDEWFPVARSADTEPGEWYPFDLLDDRYLLAVGGDGAVTVVRDTCPHRGAQLTLGSFDGERLQCPYHGWEFDLDGQCIHQPAHPDRVPPAASGLTPIAVREAHGLWWVCTGERARELPSFPADDGTGRRLVLEPAPVATSGPRIVENFLDQAHFPFVHAGWLGQVPHTEVARHGVDVVDGELRLTDCSFWQPNPGPKATAGGPVAYEYTVSHPYAATLTKVPSEADGGDLGGFSILLITSPRTETECRVFRVVCTRDPDIDTDAQGDFNRTIFEQDVPVLESQQPKRLPTDPRAEAHQPADAGSLAYRRWLVDREIIYGTDPGG